MGGIARVAERDLHRDEVGRHSQVAHPERVAAKVSAGGGRATAGGGERAGAGWRLVWHLQRPVGQDRNGQNHQRRYRDRAVTKKPSAIRRSLNLPRYATEAAPTRSSASTLPSLTLTFRLLCAAMSRSRVPTPILTCPPCWCGLTTIPSG